ncbi:GPI-anchored protein LLG1-like [Corylus avellana]|uniref:GPI-anchored protein LLG1-like n=1 Tax=Corylus avellana TaxID=13451 RepID=UPI00286BA0CC|nr:GPI-anchored protein LLG1-like [Corylus avellana]
MTSLSHFLFLFLFSFFLLTSLASSSTSLSNEIFEIFESSGSAGRALLQTKKSCSVEFEFQNYTILTSQCKGPQFPPVACCNGFKDFACPFADALNDMASDCAMVMFNYINIYGNYPPGLFANMCREGKLGLDCPIVHEATNNTKLT